MLTLHLCILCISVLCITWRDSLFPINYLFAGLLFFQSFFQKRSGNGPLAEHSRGRAKLDRDEQPASMASTYTEIGLLKVTGKRKPLLLGIYWLCFSLPHLKFKSVTILLIYFQTNCLSLFSQWHLIGALFVHSLCLISSFSVSILCLQNLLLSIVC